jgi:hypothetical protein
MNFQAGGVYEADRINVKYLSLSQVSVHVFRVSEIQVSLKLLLAYIAQ